MPKYKQDRLLASLQSRSYQGRILAPRRSIPSISIERASALKGSLPPIPSPGFGHAKVPFSKRLLNTHKPLPSQYKDLEPRAPPVAKGKERPAFDFLLQHACPPTPKVPVG